MVTNSFGAEQLEKYGWTKGKGLGANEDGISAAIKPTLKFDKHGLGHDIVKDIAFNWWDSVFNKALDTVGSSGSQSLPTVPAPKRAMYPNFVKTGEVDCDSDDNGSKDIVDTLSSAMVQMCEGRTAHKGARHGVYSSSKLERLKKAELEYLESRQQQNHTTYRKSKSKNVSKTRSRQKKRTKRLNQAAG